WLQCLDSQQQRLSFETIERVVRRFHFLARLCLRWTDQPDNLRRGSRKGRAQGVTDLQMSLTGGTILINGAGKNTKANPTLRRFVIADTSIGQSPVPRLR